jgi:ring-1,2-phenylacetyl-CoA epoxidase subunit PaaD
VVSSVQEKADLAWRSAAAVVDPELPMITIADLGILRGVEVSPAGEVTVTITPTYSGCPALAAITDDLREALTAVGFPTVAVRTQLAPAWSTDQITPAGLQALADAGIAPPEPTSRIPGARAVHVLVTLGVRCPQCGSPDTEELSRFGSTACKSLRRCRSCLEPFDAVKPF